MKTVRSQKKIITIPQALLLDCMGQILGLGGMLPSEHCQKIIYGILGCFKKYRNVFS